MIKYWNCFTKVSTLHETSFHLKKYFHEKKFSSTQGAKCLIVSFDACKIFTNLKTFHLEHCNITHWSNRENSLQKELCPHIQHWECNLQCRVGK